MGILKEDISTLNPKPLGVVKGDTWISTGDDYRGNTEFDYT